MKRICSWCKRRLLDVEGPDDQTTHTICPECKRRWDTDALDLTAVRDWAIAGIRWVKVRGGTKVGEIVNYLGMTVLVRFPGKTHATQYRPSQLEVHTCATK